MSSDVGSFKFLVPTKTLDDYVHNDILEGDMVKIWFEDTTDSFLVGKVYLVSAPHESDKGYSRTISGKSLSEVLQRRVKTQNWIATTAHAIVDELCDDLGLGKTLVDADATSVTMYVEDKSYFDILREISNYWTAGNQISKDFYVDINNNLVWKVRPFRTEVETLTVGDNIKDYVVTRNRTPVKNKITVYGLKTPFNALDPTVTGRKHPSDGDLWTWIAGWVATIGTVASSAVAPKVGATCTRGTSNGLDECKYNLTFDKVSIFGKSGFDIIEMWNRRDTATDNYKFQVQLWCPDNANYYQADWDATAGNGVWCFGRKSIGDNNTYSETNLTGQWVATGSPDWKNIQGIQIYAKAAASLNFDIDGLCFNFGRWRYTAEDATSQSRYGIDDGVFVDDKLLSDAECEARAKALLSLKKDSVIQVDLTTPLNLNIRLGDRIPLTIPAENLSAQNFDVVSVEHSLPSCLTMATMINATTANAGRQRDIIPTTSNAVLRETVRMLTQTRRMIEKKE